MVTGDGARWGARGSARSGRRVYLSFQVVIVSLTPHPGLHDSQVGKEHVLESMRVCVNIPGFEHVILNSSGSGGLASGPPY